MIDINKKISFVLVGLYVGGAITITILVIFLVNLKNGITVKHDIHILEI